MSSRANLFNLLGDDELDRIRDKLGVLFDNILDPFLLEILGLVLLEIETDLGTTAKWWVHSVRSDGESATCGRLPDVLFVVVVFRNDLNAFCDEVCGIEADTKLANHGYVSS